MIWLLLIALTFFLAVFMRVLGNWNTPLGNNFALAQSISTAAFLIAAIIACGFFMIFVVNPLFRWLFWKHWRWTLFGAACLATLIALFYAEEDWRGWHAWNKFKHEWEAKGEHFDFASMVPPPVPDDQNFALTPIAFTSYGFILTRDGKQIPYEQRDTNFVERIKMEIAHYDNWPTNGTGNWQKSTVSDLRVWQNYYRTLAAKTNEFSVPSQPQSPAADVLWALSKYDSVIEELREASRLPCSRFPLNYDTENPAMIFLPHLATLKRCGQTLQLRSLAELQNDQPEKASADVKLALQLTDKIHTEPILISHLVRIAMVNLTLQPIYEGLAEHRWSDEPLAALDAELAKLNFLADYKLAMRGEMGCQGGMIEFLRHHPEQFMNFPSDNFNGKALPFPARIVWQLIPGSFFYQNRLNCARMMVEFYIPLADVNREMFFPTLTHRADAAVEAVTRHRTPYNLLEQMLLPAFGNAAKKFACAQESVDLARVAIALERYRLAHGAYPESLDALTPQFFAKIPHDIINGQPLHYRCTSNPSSQSSDAASGQFVLYSVGWNEIDDGGEIGLTKNGNLDTSIGDWVWRYPAK